MKAFLFISLSHSNFFSWTEINFCKILLFIIYIYICVSYQQFFSFHILLYAVVNKTENNFIFNSILNSFRFSFGFTLYDFFSLFLYFFRSFATQHLIMKTYAKQHMIQTRQDIVYIFNIKHRNRIRVTKKDHFFEVASYAYRSKKSFLFASFSFFFVILQSDFNNVKRLHEILNIYIHEYIYIYLLSLSFF